MPDSKHVVITLYPPGIQRKIGTWGASTVSDPTVYHLADRTEKDGTEKIYNQLCEHVMKYGTIHEIVLGGHGNDNWGMADINVGTVCLAIERAEKELHCKVAERVVFSGCSVFSNFPSAIIKYMRDYAQTHKMEMVGSTSTTGSTVFGRYVQFTPKGEVIRDKLDARFNPLSLHQDDDSWVGYHIGRTQQEGVTAQTQAIVEEVRTIMHPYASILMWPFQDKESLRAHIAKIDASDSEIEVLVNRDGNKALIVDSDGQITKFGKFTIHRMSKEEKETVADLSRRLRVDMSSEMAVEYSKDYKNSEPVAAISMKDGKNILLVNMSGGYEYISVPPNYKPFPLPTPVSSPPARNGPGY
jgi:hypothetical protein